MIEGGQATKPRVLSGERVALPEELSRLTETFIKPKKGWIERALDIARLPVLARRARMLHHAWALFRQAKEFDAVVTFGDLEGLAVAALQRFRGEKRPVHVMYDCLWYGGSRLRRAWMRFCLRQVDRCIVWASVEAKRYAECYGLPLEKFQHVPHHHTLKRYDFEVGDEGYIFTGGNSDRDYRPFVEAVRDLETPCIIATTQRSLLKGISLPSHVKVVGPSPAEFRELMARARMVVIPMQAGLLRTAGQQTFLNAMYMGKPVIVSDPEGGADYIEDCVTGFLVPPADTESLARSIRSVLQHPEEACAVGDRARAAAAPLTTIRCNELIWREVLRLVEDSACA